MGFSVSWLGFKGISKENILKNLKMCETDKVDRDGFPVEGALYSGSDVPDGWYVIHIDSIESKLIEKNALREVSNNCMVIACYVNEHSMKSSCGFYEGGELRWEIKHDSKLSNDHIEKIGDPPDFEVIFSKALTEQAIQDSSEFFADYIFDVPLEIAFNIVKYRHNKYRFEWGSPRFFELVTVRPQLPDFVKSMI